MKSILIVLLFTRLILAQCSDAGICTVGNDPAGEENKFNAGLVYSFGSSGKDDEVKFHSIIFSSDYNFTESTGLHIAIPFSIQKGPLGEVSGIGDLLILIKQVVYKKDNFNINFQAGSKLATGRDNKSELPQIYQSGLGSNDILAGFIINYLNFNFGAAYQLAGKRNSNILELERGDDLLVRGGVNFSLIDNLDAHFELLTINRLAESTIRSPLNNSIIKVEESNSFQINIAGKFNYKLAPEISIPVFGAVPLRQRADNTDGLKRSITISSGINYIF